MFINEVRLGGGGLEIWTSVKIWILLSKNSGNGGGQSKNPKKIGYDFWMVPFSNIK